MQRGTYVEVFPCIRDPSLKSRRLRMPDEGQKSERASLIVRYGTA
jgi:hypothetical protein